MNRPWRCEVCGIGVDEADRRRLERGERALTVRALTCSMDCAIERRKQNQLAALWVARRRAPPPHRGRAGEWRCSECGANEATTRAKRRRAGLREVLIVTQVTCTPECKRARVARLLAWGSARRERKREAGRRAARRRR